MKHCLTSPFYIATTSERPIAGAPFFAKKKDLRKEGLG